MGSGSSKSRQAKRSVVAATGPSASQGQPKSDASASVPAVVPAQTAVPASTQPSAPAPTLADIQTDKQAEFAAQTTSVEARVDDPVPASNISDSKYCKDAAPVDAHGNVPAMQQQQQEKQEKHEQQIADKAQAQVMAEDSDNSFPSRSPPLIENMVVKIQHKAPAFSAEAVVNGEFKTVSLSDYAGKYLVLFFYPLDFTFVCPTEIIAFSDRIEEFKKLGVEVVAASVDSKYSHLAWVNQPRKAGGLGEMKIPIIADITKQISRDYGVLVEDGPDHGVALRGTFIIDKHQNVRVMQINDLPIGRSVDEVLRLIEALQFNEQYGDVCPAGWKKGDLAMTADPKASLDYFGKVHDASTKTYQEIADSEIGTPKSKRSKSALNK